MPCNCKPALLAPGEKEKWLALEENKKGRSHAPKLEKRKKCG
jgi:hypothetical protein